MLYLAVAYMPTSCLSSPAIPSSVHHDGRARRQRQRDSKLQVRSREAHPSVQVDQDRPHAGGILLTNAE